MDTAKVPMLSLDQETPDNPTGGSFARCGGWIAVWKWGMQSSSKIDWTNGDFTLAEDSGKTAPRDLIIAIAR